MSISYFLDTNIIVYANDSRDPEKQKKAVELVSEAMISHEGVISTQVLQEYSNVALKKLNQECDVVLRQLVLLESLHVIHQSPMLIRRGIEIMATYKISFWDACIISAAEHASCDFIYSEDLNGGQFYCGMKVKNPFEMP